MFQEKHGMSKVYLYKMTTDNGGAPCVHDGKLSLAICKPAIRTSARCGDYIIGFAGNSLYENNCVVYATKVSRCLPGTEYYANRYKLRPDCIYEFSDGIYRRRPGAKYHSPEDLEHDLGKPRDYGRARVLLAENSSDFRYFGSSCPIPYQSKYRELSIFVREMTQGHRTSLSESLRTAVLSLRSEVLNTPETPGDSCVPSDRSLSKCSRDEGDAECDC
jgi:hypothetical protein